MDVKTLNEYTDLKVSVSHSDAVSVYNSHSLKLLAIFKTKNIAHKSLFLTSVNLIQTLIQKGTKNNSNISNQSLTFRYAVPEQIKMLGNEDYIIIDKLFLDKQDYSIPEVQQNESYIVLKGSDELIDKSKSIKHNISNIISTFSCELTISIGVVGMIDINYIEQIKKVAEKANCIFELRMPRTFLFKSNDVESLNQIIKIIKNELNII